MFAFTILGVALYYFSYYSVKFNLPNSYRDFCCIDDRRFNLFFIFIPILIFSILFLIFKRNLKSFTKFTFIYTLIYTIFYFLVPTQGDGFFWLQRETISFVGSIFYSIISFIFIIYQIFQKER